MSLIDLKQKMEIEFLKSKTYTEINEMFNQLNGKLIEANKQSSEKEAEIADLREENNYWQKRIALLDKTISEQGKMYNELNEAKENIQHHRDELNDDNELWKTKVEQLKSRISELERRHSIIMSEPNDIVRDTMIANLLID